MRFLRHPRSLVLAAGLFLFLALSTRAGERALVVGNGGYTATWTGTLAASTATYFPSSSGISVDLYQDLSIQWRVQEATGNDPSVTLTAEVSNDGSNWTTPFLSATTVVDPNTPTTVVFGRTQLPAIATTWATDDTWRLDQFVLPPCLKLRLKVTENAGDADVTFTGVFYAD